MSASLALPWAPLSSAAQRRPTAQQAQAQPSAALGLRPLLPGCRRCCRWRPAPQQLAPAAAAAAAAAGSEGDLRPQVEADSIIDPDGTVHLQPQSAEDRKDLWRRAIKLPMYSVGWAPILVSAAAAYMQTGTFDPARTLLLCLAATAIIGWLNLSNDVFDGMTGVDRSNKPESVVALLGGNTRLVFGLATALLLAGGGLLFWLLQSAGNPLAPKMLYAAIAMGYIYQGPPFRWSYLGLGEPLCFLAFGPLATCAFYFAQVPPAQAVFNKMILGLSTLVGLTTTVILFCAHFHQIEGDRAHGKMSPLVRLGTKTGTEVLKGAVGTTYILAAALAFTGVLPFSVLTSVIVAYGMAGEMVKLAETNMLNPDGLKTLKFLATKWHIAFSAMLVLGLLLSTLIMVPIRLIVMGWRKGVSKLDAALVDKEDEEAVQAYEKRRGTKHGILKAPYVLMNLFRKIGGGGKKKGKGSRQAAEQEQEDPNTVPQAVPLPGGTAGQAGYAVI